MPSRFVLYNNIIIAMIMLHVHNYYKRALVYIVLPHNTVIQYTVLCNYISV